MVAVTSKYIYVCARRRPLPHPPAPPNTQTCSGRDASDHYGPLFHQNLQFGLFASSWRVCERRYSFISLFLAPFLAKHQTSGKAVLLKCQLKMKINNSEAGRKGDTANISPHPRTGLALPPGAGWRLTGGEAGSGSRGGVPSVWAAAALGLSLRIRRINRDEAPTLFCYTNTHVYTVCMGVQIFILSLAA